MKRLPPLPALHTFLITAQCCNFTRAGEQLHITQGAVSRQIAGLEEHLGYPLFHRQARGLSLTEQGQARWAGQGAAATGNGLTQLDALHQGSAGLRRRAIRAVASDRKGAGAVRANVRPERARHVQLRRRSPASS